MNEKILEIHIKNLGPARILITVAVEREQGVYSALQATASAVSNYDVNTVMNTGKLLDADQAGIIFATLSGSYTYLDLNA